MRFRRHRHRALATLLAFAWLVGIEALPALHLAAHDDGHTHEPDGTIVRATSIRVTFGGHRHADGTVHGGHADEAHGAHVADGGPVHATRSAHAAGGATRSAKPKRRIEQLAFRAPASAHDATGLAHHATALSEPPPALLVPPFVAHVAIAPALAVDQLHSRSVARPNARGPPLA